jgi:hypothetical protein
MTIFLLFVYASLLGIISGSLIIPSVWPKVRVLFVFFVFSFVILGINFRVAKSVHYR